MLGMLEDIVGADYALAAFWAIIVIVFLLLVLVILMVMRRVQSGVYVAGGRNRKPRLSIMDAAAVDTHRRLVLVRRDDVEHLLLIGGNSDIVVERDIRLSSQTRRAAPLPEAFGDEAPAPARPAAAVRPAVQAVRPQTPPPVRANSPQPLSSASVARPAQPVRPAAPVAKPKDQLDDDLMKELESALDIDEVVEPPKAKPSLDDEMAKLLGELTNHKR